MEKLRQKRTASESGPRNSAPSLHLPSQGVRLTNGRYRVWLSGLGSGVSEWEGLAVSRGVPDQAGEADGFHVYLRDLEQSVVWSAGYQPTCVLPDSYQFRYSSVAADIIRIDGDIESRLTVCVAPDRDYELRRCRITNHSDRTRRIELTSYVEFVLTSREADANHPTFSKLFVETEFCRDGHAILARRRPRSSTERESWALHRVLFDSDSSGDLQFETNRKNFIGRGRDLARPRALDRDMRLTGDQGAVLDPIGSLRVAVTIGPGETREVAYLLGAASSRMELEELVSYVEDLAVAQRLFVDGLFVDDEDTVAASNGKGRLRIAHPPHVLRAEARRESKPQAPFRPASVTADITSPRLPEALRFENSFGGFSGDGREYVVRIEPDAAGDLRLPPQPWVNVLANEHAGCLVTERGAGYTWAGNSRHNRLTTWHNDPVCDPHSEALWIRDEEAGEYWSPLPGPTPAQAPYEVRHGFGYTNFLHTSRGLAQHVTVFMAPNEPLKIVRVRLENQTRSTRRITLFSYLQWSLRSTPVDSEPIRTVYDPNLTAILAHNAEREVYANHVAFSAVAAGTASAANFSYTGEREAFVGPFGTLASPAAVAQQKRLNNRTGSAPDACAAWCVPLVVRAGETVECAVLLGESADHDSAAALIQKYRQPDHVHRALEQVVADWEETLSAVQIETPDPEIDLMVNGWLPYQNLACRMWGRSAYYQPGGAYGFRDQLQDSAALVYHAPAITRRQILRHAEQQFVEGDVMHWWHPDRRVGLRTRFSDDLVWLPYVTASYVNTTGDDALLDEMAPFLRAPMLAEGQHEVCLPAVKSGTAATVYEHCCLALDRALTAGDHGLPLIGSGDWNDGMNCVGRLGRGESVWLGFFLYTVLGQMISVCDRRGDRSRSEKYSNDRRRIAAALESAGWDGGWYRRAFYDNGQPLGSAESDECQIDALAQAWAVLSGAAPPDRAEMAMRAAEERLVDERAGLIRLLTPPFDKTPNDPGYIKGYVPGVRENGGQYTHGVLWFIRALAEMGRGSRAVELMRMLSPVSHTSTAARVAVYQTEPYVVAADVYSKPPHAGRGGWTWYTGSAGWMLRVAVESILGLSIESGKTLVIRPAISSAWPQCRLRYRCPDRRTQYDILIENPAGKETGVTAATLDGRDALVVDGAARIPLEPDGKSHHVVVRL